MTPSLHNRLFRLFTQRLAVALFCTVIATGSLFTPTAQGAFLLTGTNYSQDFDGLGSTETFITVAGGDLGLHSSTLTGWYFAESGSNANPPLSLTLRTGTGSSNTGDTYNFGLTSNPDRALGGLLSGSLTPSWGFYFTNDTGSTIAALDIGYTGQTWRVGNASRSDRIDFQYSLNATGLTNGTWVDVDSLDYANPGQATGSGSVQHSAPISDTISSLNILDGESFFIRWTDFNASGADDGMAVNDFSLNATLLSPGSSLYWLGGDTDRGGAGTWQNSGGSAWSTTDADGGPGVAWDSSKTAIFNTAPATVSVTGTVNVNNGINFDLGSDGTTISGGTAINLGGATAADNTLFTTGGVTATIGTNLTGSNGLSKTGSGTLVLTGDKSYTGGTTISSGTLQLGDGTTNGSVLGNITNDATLAFNNGSAQNFGGDISGSGVLIKDGSGNLTLSGINTYSGGTTVNAGILTGTTNSLQGNIANNAAVAFDQATDGTYAGDISGSGSLTKAGAGNLTLSGINSYSGGSTVSGGILTGNTDSLQGNIANNAAVAFDQASDGTYAGDMSGSGSLTKNGAGNLTLSGANTYSGGTTVSGGVLTGTTSSLQGNIANNTTVVFSQNTDGTYAGDMSGTGSLSKAGVGSVSLSGNNSYSGGTTVTGGTLVAGSNTALGSGDVNVNGATLFAGAGFTVANAITVNEVLAAPALVAYWNFNDYNGGAGPISATAGSGTISLDDWTGTTANFGGSGINALFGDPNGSTLSLRGDGGNGSYIEIGGLDFGALVDAQVTFATRGTSTGFDSGQWSFSTDGINFTDFGGNTATRSGFGLADTGTTGGLDNSTTGFLRYTLDGATSSAGNNRIDNLQINATSPDAFPVLGTGATSGTATFAGNVTLDSDVELTAATGGTAAFDGVIQNGANGPAGLTKTGGGTVILSGDNTYSGASLVSGGTLIINGDQSAATGDVLVAAGSTLGGSGVIGGQTTILGTHNPGESPGTQTFAAGLTYGSGSNVEWELIGNTTAGRGVNFDGINVTGVLDFSAPTPLDLVFNLPGSAVDWSDSFWRTDYFTTDGWLLYEVTNGSISNFDNLFINSTTWLDGFGNSSNAFFAGKEFGLFRDGNNIYLTYTPEPSKAVLLALGLIGLLARRRR